MQLRAILSLVNFAAIGAAIVILLAFPQVAGYAVYVLLPWIFVSLGLMYSPWANRTVGASPASSGVSVSSDAPLSSSSGHVHASSIGFCMYCAAPLEPGTARCPACGRALPHFS